MSIMTMTKIIDIQDIIELSGGIRHVASVLNLDPASVRRWPSNKVGIPKKYWKPIADIGGATIATIKDAHTKAKTN